MSDQGSDFTSVTIKELNKLLKIKYILSSPYHPQTNGVLQRSHSTLKDYLKHYINQNQKNWDQYVELSTRFNPFELIFGHKAIIPSSLTSQPEFKYSYDYYYSNLKLKFNCSYQISKVNIIKPKEKSKLCYDFNARQINFQAGNLVLLQQKQVKQGLTKKLPHDYNGPYKIVKIYDNKAAQVEAKPNKSMT